MLLDLLNAGLAIATLKTALRQPERVGLLFFLAAPNSLWIVTYFPAPDCHRVLYYCPDAGMHGGGFCA